MGPLMGAKTELAPGPRAHAFPGQQHVNTCTRAGPGRVCGRGQGVSHITSPLSLGTCRVLPSSSGWHGQGCQRMPLMPGVPQLPLLPPPPTPPIVRGQLAATGAGDRGPRPWGRLLGLGLAGLHRKVRIGPGALGTVKSSSGVRGQYGARMEGPAAVWAFSASSSSPRAQGALSCMGLGSQPWRNLPNLAPSYATMNEPFSPEPGGSRRKESGPLISPKPGLHCRAPSGPSRPSQADKSRI